MPSKAGIIAGKFLQGAAPVLAKGAENEQKADLAAAASEQAAEVQRKRDEKLEGYRAGAATKVADAAVVKGDADRASRENIAANQLAASNVRHQQSLDATKAGRGSRIRPPDDIAKANWLMAHVPGPDGGKMTHDQAWSEVQRVKKLSANPNKFQEEWVLQRMKNHDELSGEPFDPDVAVTEAQQIFNSIGGTAEAGDTGLIYQTPEEIKEAFENKDLTREEANAAYQQLLQRSSE